MSNSRNINYRAIHTKNPWRKASHTSIEKALGPKRGAKALFAGKAAIDYEKQGNPLFVIIWEKHADEGYVVKQDPNDDQEIITAAIPIQDIMRYEEKGRADTLELENYFKHSEEGLSDGEENLPAVDEHILSSILSRRGQQEFRSELIRAYQGCCAVTGCNVVPVLEAAHIIPHSVEQSYLVNNGLLLRADIHTLFDLFLLSVEPESGNIVFSPEVEDSYPELVGTQIKLPQDQSEAPCPSAMKAHYQSWCKKWNG